MTINPDFKGGGVTDDPVVNRVIDLILKRHMQGMSKFGKTMDENNRPLDQWMTETIEELIDAIHYLEKSKSIIDKFKNKEKQLESMIEQFKQNTFVETKDKNEGDKTENQT
tara:strand:- start:3717 stop:4049 length:333 start_codon:yes stop_codon:yes gene_type:complete